MGGCYLRHEEDGFTENVPWASLAGDKYAMGLLPLAKTDMLADNVLLAKTLRNDVCNPCFETTIGLLHNRHLNVGLEGAGIELTACKFGYLVERIDLFPGQPDFRVGDVIVAIETTPLIGLDPEDLESRFGLAFRDGAAIVAGRRDVLAHIRMED